VIKASNEKAVTDGSVAGSTAAVSPTEAGEFHCRVLLQKLTHIIHRI